MAREPAQLWYRATRKPARVVFSGSGTLAANGQAVAFARPDWLETAPTVLHCCAGDSIEATNHGDQVAEVFVVQTPNPSRSLHASTVRVTFRLNTGPGHPPGYLSPYRPAGLRRQQRAA